MTSLFYNWTVNGIALDEESDTLFIDFPVGSEISCSITTFDGTDYGKSKQQPVFKTPFQQ